VGQLELFFKILEIYPGAIMLAVAGVILWTVYILRINDRLVAMEVKLGVRHNGKPLEEVLTKADMIEFREKLVKELNENFVSSDVCLLRHDATVEKVTEILRAMGKI